MDHHESPGLPGGLYRHLRASQQHYQPSCRAGRGKGLHPGHVARYPRPGLVIYYKIEGMGHAWSGGTLGSIFTDPNGPDASEIIYEFFMAHPRGQRGYGRSG